MKKKLIITAAITSVLAVSGVGYAATRPAPTAYKSTPVVSKTVKAEPTKEAVTPEPAQTDTVATTQTSPKPVAVAPAPVAPKVLFDVSGSSDPSVPKYTDTPQFSSPGNWSYTLTYSGCSGTAIMTFAYFYPSVSTAFAPHVANAGSGTFTSTGFAGQSSPLGLQIKTAPGATCTWHIVGTTT